MDDNSQIAKAQQHMLYDAHRKSTGATYILWALLGGAGAHRFYLGRMPTAITMLILWLLGWFTAFLTWLPVIAWWLVDLFLIPGMVRQENLKVADGIAFR